MRKTLAAAWIAMLPALALPQTSDAPSSTHDVRALTRRVEMVWPDALLPLQAAFRSIPATKTYGFPSFSVVEEHTLIGLLRDAAGEESVEFFAEGGGVVVRGTQAGRDAVAARIKELTAQLLQEVRVDVYSVTPGPETPAGVLNAAEVDGVLGTKGSVALGSTTLVLGEPGHLRSGRSTSFVSDYDVEVAEGAAIGKPVIRVVQEGLDLRTSVGQALDGRLIVRFSLRRAALSEPLAARAIGSTKLGDVQLPRIRSSIVAGAALAEDGGGFLARHDGGVGPATLVRVRRVGGTAPQATAADSRVLFADDRLGSPIVAEIPRVHDDQRSESEKDYLALADPRTGPLVREPSADTPEPGTSRAHELALTFLGEELQKQIVVAGSRIHFRADPASASRVRDILAGLAKGTAENFTVEFRIGSTELPLVPWNPDDLAPRLKIAAAVPATGADQFLITGGEERATVIDQDVEIAQKVVIADPRVAPLFDGYVIGGAVSASESGRIELVCDLQHQHILPGPEGGFPLNAENVGPVDLPQIVATGGRFRTFLEPGRWGIVATANGSGSPATLVVLARVRKS